MDIIPPRCARQPGGGRLDFTLLAGARRSIKWRWKGRAAVPRCGRRIPYPINWAAVTAQTAEGALLPLEVW